jgi:hypothetical protein
MSERREGSILAADIGNVSTRVILVDVVDGRYRLLARGETRSTGGFPSGDVNVGIRRACEQIAEATGRKLIDVDGRVLSPERTDRSGVDTFVATTSTGQTLRTVIIGLVPELSVASALRATAGTYVQVVEQISLADGRSDEDELNAIIHSRPDLIFIVGGVEAGADAPVMRLARLAQMACLLLKGGRMPIILYAGNSDLVDDIQDLFRGLATVLVAENIRPTLEEEKLENAARQLARAFDERQDQRGAGFKQLGDMSRVGILPTAQSYNLIASYLGQSLGGDVLLVDIGSAVSTLSASVNGRVSTVIRPDIGLGHSAESLYNLAGDAAVARWLPFVPSPNQIRHYALNKSLRPSTLPETTKGLFLEHGLLRAGIRALLDTARPGWSGRADVPLDSPLPPFKRIIAAGAALTRTGSAGFNALLMLDSIQPTGVTELEADSYGILAVMGALAQVNPTAAVQVLDGLNLDRLGTAFNLSGKPAADRPALRVKIRLEAGGEPIKHDVPGGQVWVYPLATGQHATVEVSVRGRGLNIGGRGRVKMQVEGGSAGLIFDARGRMLPVAAEVRQRAAQLPAWIAAVTGDIPILIDPNWLVDSAEEGHVDTAPPPKSRRSKKAAEPAPVSDGKKAKVKPKPSGRRGRGKQAAPEPEIEMPSDDEMSLDDLRG